MPNNTALPFDLTTEALAGWLDTLTTLSPSMAANQLNQVLKQIKRVKSPAATLLPLLINLTPLTLHLSNALTTAVLSDAKPSDKTIKIAKLCMQLPRQLSLIFSQIAEKDGVDTGVMQTAMYYALQLIGSGLRCYSLLHEMPSSTLWQKSAALYSLAANHQCLLQNQPTKLAEFKSQPNIEAVIKRNLLFAILNPAFHDSADINLLFLFANQHALLLETSTEPDAWDFGYYWDLNGDLPPCTVKQIRKRLPEGFMAIDSRRLGQALQLGELTTNLHPATQNKLALYLTGYLQIFNAIIPGQPSPSQLILGFTNICAYLQEQSKLEKIRRLSAQLPGADRIRPKMALIPLEHERSIFDKASQSFSKPDISRTVNILKTPISSYIIIEGGPYDAETGNIVLLYKEQHPTSLAIIRQQHVHDVTSNTHILLEKLAGHCCVYSFSNDNGNQQAIMIDEDGSNPEVLLAAGKYANYSTIELNMGRTLRLTACLETNAFFARFRISFDW